ELVASESDSGPVAVKVDDHTIAEVRPAVAVDAAGHPVHVSYEVAGDRLTVKVPHRDAGVEYPVLVDPEVFDSTISSSAGWRTETSRSDWNMNPFDGGSYLAIQPQGGVTYNAGDITAWVYTAGGALPTPHSVFLWQAFTKN